MTDIAGIGIFTEDAVSQGSRLAQSNLVSGRCTVGAMFGTVLHANKRSIELFWRFRNLTDRGVFELENCFLNLSDYKLVRTRKDSYK